MDAACVTLRWTVLLALTVLAGCAMPRGPRFAPPSSTPPPDYTVLRVRSLGTFDQAMLLKPGESSVDGLAASLAPLLVLEMLPIDRAAGGTIRDAAEEAHVEAGTRSAPNAVSMVYVATGTTTVEGRAYDVVTYLWGIPGGGDVRDRTMRGIRATVGADGFPLVWEAFDGRSVRLLYVSETLERAAREQFGAPFAGRAFSAERSPADTPLTAVVRTIEDGPIPLGPYVYLCRENHAIVTLHCRCSAAQFDTVLEADFYELGPLEVPPPDLGWIGEAIDLGRHLRWPAGL